MTTDIANMVNAAHSPQDNNEDGFDRARLIVETIDRRRQMVAVDVMARRTLGYAWATRYRISHDISCIAIYCNCPPGRSQQTHPAH